MPYYQGDYYRGDYYRGDPGFWGAVGGAFKGAVGGLLTGGPLGAIKGGVTGAITGYGGARSPVVTPALPPPSAIITESGMNPFGSVLPRPGNYLVGGGGVDVKPGTPGSVPTPGLGGVISRFLPGGMSGFSGAPAGFHINKAYVRYLRAIAMGHHATDPFKAPRAVNTVVKNRRMNPLNPRALRHAIRRQRNMVTLMRHTLAGSGFHISKRGFGGKKATRRRR